MSLPEQAGKVVGTTVEALKGSPGLLGVIIMQFATMALIYAVSASNAEQRQAREMMLLDRCLDKTDAILGQLK